MRRAGSSIGTRTAPTATLRTDSAAARLGAVVAGPGDDGSRTGCTHRRRRHPRLGREALATPSPNSARARLARVGRRCGARRRRLTYRVYASPSPPPAPRPRGARDAESKLGPGPARSRGPSLRGPATTAHVPLAPRPSGCTPQPVGRRVLAVPWSTAALPSLVLGRSLAGPLRSSTTRTGRVCAAQTSRRGGRTPRGDGETRGPRPIVIPAKARIQETLGRSRASNTRG
jgi:hypothetical protein